MVGSFERRLLFFIMDRARIPCNFQIGVAMSFKRCEVFNPRKGGDVRDVFFIRKGAAGLPVGD